MESRRALPEKKYFKIGEVADLVGVEPHVLRYWETQFPQIRPHKARSGHRLYRRREVEALLVIRELLHVQRFTIAGARQALRQPGGISSILPRFFDAPEGLIGAGAHLRGGAGREDPNDSHGLNDVEDHDAEAAEHLAPAGIPGGADEGFALASRAGDESEPPAIELEAEGLEREELAAAMEREAMERVARRGVVEVELVGVEPPERTAPVRKPAQVHVGHAGHVGQAAHMGAMGALSLSPRKRELLEGAMADARSILALLDRLDREALRDPVHA